jgi:transposase
MKRDMDGHGVEAACEEIGRLYDAGRRDELLAIVRELLGAALENADKLAARVTELQRTLYGRKGERLSPNQLAWVFAVQADEEQPQHTRDAEKPDELASNARPRLGRRQGGRGQGSLPAHLPREEIRLAPTAEQLVAAGGTMRKWREERSMVLEYVPPSFKVLVYVREVWSNDLGDVVTGPAPVKVLDKGLPGLELLVQILLAKFRDHVPLARQTRIYQRLGVELSRNTLVDWVGGAAQLLRLLAYLIYRQVLGSHVVQADDTKLPVQDRRKAKNIKRGRLWALVGDHFYVAYRYAPDWRATTTFELLGERIGWLQVDAYKGYEPIFAAGRAIEVGCNMHCRRYFVRALEAKDVRAARPLQLYQQLYAIEAASREAAEGPDARLLRRQRDSKPIFDELSAWIQQHAGAVRPSSPLGKAITYANNHWTALCRPLEDGRLELDNGDCERTMRGPAVGRRYAEFGVMRSW